jgi:hypothetical protein
MPSRQNDVPFNMFPTSSTNHKNNHQSTFYYQPQSPPVVPTRPAPSVPILTPMARPIVNTGFQQPLTLKNLSINPPNNTVTDLLDLGDPGSPPPSPKFDPYG